MLPQEHRLKQRQDFSDVYRYGIRRTTRYLTLRAKRRRTGSTEGDKPDPSEHTPLAEAKPSSQVASSQPSRVGISISQKVSKRAVVRNRLKRQIRSAVRQLLPYLSPGWDLAIVVQPAAVECNYRQLLQELEQLLARAEVLNGHQRGNLL